ncbi:MAG: cation-transporting P-type ATPase [Pseudomonadota bacterium]
MGTLKEGLWHHLPPEELLAQLGCHAERGLDPAEAESRLAQFGPNRLTPKMAKGPILRFLVQFHQPLVYILLAAGVTTGLISGWSDATAIFAVVLVNAIIGFVQESKALGAIEALSRTMTTSASVVRDAQPRLIPSEELVPGDIVALQSGDKVPADMRLLRMRDLKIDESALTGESVAVEKAVGILDGDTVLADRSNMAYASSLVTYGQGTGVVVATGDRTEMGRISQLIAEVKSLETPLTRKIGRFSHVLLLAILALGGITFLAGLLHGKSVIDMFMAAVALTVGAIPEGLPAAVTIILAVGVGRMAGRRAIIRRLPAVETLGSTTVVCSDKTGTLTENQMTVQHVLAGGRIYSVTGIGYDPSGTFDNACDPNDGSQPCAPLRECLRAGLLCNDSRLIQEDGRWQIEGDPTEGSLLVAARKGGLSEEIETAIYPRQDTIPFESVHQYMATLHGTPQAGSQRIYVKGSLERILPRCTRILEGNGSPLPIDPAPILEAAEKLAGMGLRVLAFARRDILVRLVGFRHDDVSSDLTFLGLQGMIDPPREEAIEAVHACLRAGIQVKMITGDHALTASVIAEKIGIVTQPECLPSCAAVLTGKQMALLSPEELVSAAEETNVFARVAPEQKLNLVRALQTRGHVVAMTGDGVNDAPALKQADIGVAMGITGTEVSKEAADMVLTDDNFASIEAAVEEGRCVFDNLIKFLVWALPTNLGQGLVIIAAVFAGVPLPILPVQSLWINMTTAGSLGLMLAFEPKERGLMSRPPRHPSSPILSGALIRRILIIGVILMAAAFGLFEWEEWNGAGDAAARTVTVNVFSVISCFYLLNCRSLHHSFLRVGLLSNKLIIVGIAFMVILQLLFTYLPLMNRLFHTVPIGYDSWLRIMAVGLISHWAVSFEKWLSRRAADEQQRI